MDLPTPLDLHAQLQTLGHVVFEGPMNLTLVAIRQHPERSEPNTFEDLVGALYQDEQLDWQLELFPATTKPGRYWLEHPMRREGTAILTPGQYRRCFGFGLHRGRYRALKQIGMMNFVRDNDLDELPELNGDLVSDPFDAIIGCNLHHAAVSRRAATVDRWSAACQVVQGIEDFDRIMALADASALRYGYTFSYTLIDEWR